MDAITSYLQSGRLADVLALIQVLAYDRDAYRTEAGLEEELQRKPSVGDCWMSVAKQHPEFFRVRDDETRKKRIALLARYVLDHQLLPDGEEKRPPLEPTVANKLMELAIQLHDKQFERQNRWKSVVLPMTVAVIAAGASISAAVITSAKSVTPTFAQQTTPLERPTVLPPMAR